MDRPKPRAKAATWAKYADHLEQRVAGLEAEVRNAADRLADSDNPELLAQLKRRIHQLTGGRG